MGTSRPSSANTCRAASRIRTRLRSASARRQRSAVGDRRPSTVDMVPSECRNGIRPPVAVLGCATKWKDPLVSCVLRSSHVPTIAVVGAGPGLGLSVALVFGAQDFDVGLVARNQAKLAQLVAALGEKGVCAAHVAINP